MDNQTDYEKMNEEFLLEYSREKVQEYIPVFALTAFVILFGVIGNAFAYVYYGFKGPHTTSTFFLAAIALIDLITCIVCSDFFFEDYYNVMFPSGIACKLIYFVNHLCVVSSALLFSVIGIDRYLKVCRSLKRQFSSKGARISVAAVLVFACLESVYNVFSFDLVRVNITDNHGNLINGRICSYNNAEYDGILDILHYMDFVIFALTIVIMCILYGCVIKRLLKMGRKKASLRKSSISVITHTCASQNSQSGFRNDFRVAEKHITITVVAITAGLFVSFIPYFIVVIYLDPYSNLEQFELSASMVIAHHSYMLNSAVNPYILGFFNPAFRQYVASVVCGSCRSLQS